MNREETGYCEYAIPGMLLWVLLPPSLATTPDIAAPVTPAC